MKKLIRFVVSAKEGQAFDKSAVLQVFPAEEMGPVSPFITIQHHLFPGSKVSAAELQVVLTGCPEQAAISKPGPAALRSLPTVMKQPGVYLKLLTGDLDGESSELQTAPPLVCITGEIEKGRRVQFSAAEGSVTLIYVMRGGVNIHLESIGEHQLVLFEQEHEEIFVCAEKDSTIFYLSASPAPMKGDGQLKIMMKEGKSCELIGFA